MIKKKFTVVTQLHAKNNEDIIRYFEESRNVYSRAVREIFYVVKKSEDFDKASFNTYLQNKYGILKRTANSIISDAVGRLNALKELKAYEQKQLRYKIESLIDDIGELEAIKADNCAMLRANVPVNLIKHRNLRRKLVAKKAKLNRLTQRLNTLTYQIEHNIYKLCFGTKKLLKSDYDAFIAQRDSQIGFVGTKSEKAGNQLLQLSFDAPGNQFNVQLRKDFGGFKNTADKYAFGRVYFNHHLPELKAILQYKNSPLSFKIIKRNGRYYLYCTFEIQRDESDFKTRSSYGTIGLDFNKGFVTLSETNQYGHLVAIEVLPYRFKAGSCTTNDLRQLAKYVVERAESVGKDICIEDLDFKVKKAKTQAKKNKKYNEMIHSLAYRQFTNYIEYTGHYHFVLVKRVNPAWTSWLAKQLYCPKMKLNTHIGAAFVIARRGQGYKDFVKS